MSGRSEPRQQPGYACEECRKKKLRCDRQRPQCGYCMSSGIPCRVNEQRVPRGSRKRNVQSAHTPIVTSEKTFSPLQSTPGVTGATFTCNSSEGGLTTDSEWDIVALNDDRTPRSTRSSRRHVPESRSPSHVTHVHLPPTPASLQPPRPDENFVQGDNVLSEFTRADLTQLYFDRVQPTLPILWESKIYAWMSEEPQTNEYRHCLQYAILTLASAFSTQFDGIRDALYTKTRSMLDGLDLKDGEMTACQIEHIQAWILITFYEFTKTPYRRGWLSAGRVFRLVQLLRLYDVDNPKFNTDHEQDAIEKEEKRRVFWVAYCLDRLISVSNASPVTLSEEVVGTRLPCPDSEFQSGLIRRAPFLSEAISSVDMPYHSALAECVIMVTIGSRALTHKQVSDVESMYGSAPRDFSARHVWLVNMVTQRLESLQKNYPCLSVASDPLTTFTYILAQTAVVYLCCIMEPFLGNEEYRDLPWDFLEKGPVAAQEIARLAKQHTPLGYFKMHTFMPLPIYLSVVKLKLHREQRREPEYSLEAVKAIEQSLQDSLDALRKLESVNNLATYYLGLLDGKKDLVGLTLGDGWCLGTGLDRYLP